MLSCPNPIPEIGMRYREIHSNQYLCQASPPGCPVQSVPLLSEERDTPNGTLVLHRRLKGEWSERSNHPKMGTSDLLHA